MKDYKENYGMYKDLKTILPKVIENIEANYKNDFDNEKQYVTTDFKGINFKKGNLIILASRPCLGMTSLALSLLLNIMQRVLGTGQTSKRQQASSPVTLTVTTQPIFTATLVGTLTMLLPQQAVVSSLLMTTVPLR